MHDLGPMSVFTRPVSEFMTAPVTSIGVDAALSHVAHTLDQQGVSALPVVDGKGAIIGVLSRTDLLRVGRIQAGSHRRAAVLTMPEKTAGEQLGANPRAPIVVAPTAPVRDAARAMCEHHVHRLFVVDGGRPVGVVSTLDLTRAVGESRNEAPITEVMSSPVFTVKAQQPISAAVERLENAKVAGLVVLDDGWPVGVFTQVEALQARDRLGRRQVGFDRRQVGQRGRRGQLGQAQVRDRDPVGGTRCGEVGRDHAALLAAAEHENVHEVLRTGECAPKIE